MCKVKICYNDKAIEKSGTSEQNLHYYAIVPKCIYCFVILISFHFSHASMIIIKVSNKIIDSLNRIYLNECYILLLIYLVRESGIITY